MTGFCDKNAQGKIIEAVMELVEMGSGAEITVREIAARAGVNVGAINYYFGSKDELMNTVASDIMLQFLNSLSVLDDKNLPPFYRLEKSLVSLAEMLVSKHLFFKREVFSKQRQFKDKHEMMRYFKNIGIEKVRLTVLELDDTLDDARSFILALQIFTAAIMPNMFFLHNDIFTPGENRSTDSRLPTVQEQVHGFLARIFPGHDDIPKGVN